MHKKHSMLDRQKQRELLETLKKRFSTLENLRRQQKQRMWPRHYHHQYPVNEIIPGQDYLMNYYDLDLKLGYPEMKSGEDDGQGYGDALGYRRTFVDEEEEPMLGFHGKWMEGGSTIVLHEGGRENTAPPAAMALSEALVTYRFDKPNLEEKHPFAVKPNDPRYYSNAPFSSSGKYTQADSLVFLVLRTPSLRSQTARVLRKLLGSRTSRRALFFSPPIFSPRFS